MSSGDTARPRFVDGIGLDTLEPWLDTLRNRGASGQVILQHRALRRSRAPRERILGAALLSLVMFVIWYQALPAVAEIWVSVLEFCRAAVGMAGFTSLVTYELGPFDFSVPYLTFPSGLPDNLLWWIGTAITALLVAASLLTPQRYLPLAYFLRVVAFFQGTSQVYFALWLHHFPYGGAGYVHGNFIAGLMFVSLIPLVLGFTYNLFEFSLSRKILLTVVMVAHMVVMIPFQFFMHALVVYSFSLLFMPVMFFIFGLPANVMMFIAFFGWGFSWRNQWDLDRDRKGNRSRATAAVAAVVLLALCLGVAPAAEGQTVQEIEERLPQVIPEEGPVLERTASAGFGAGKYTGDTNPNNGQFVKVTFNLPGKHSYAVDVGRQQRFGQTGYGIGGNYTKVLDAATSLTVGGNTGTSDLLPYYRLGVTGIRSLAGNVVSAGLSYEKSKVGIKSTGLHAGISRWLAHWILAAGGSVYFGSPGDTTSPSLSLSATWYNWKRIYVGAGITFGRVSYLVLGPTDALVDYNSTSYNLGASYWIDGGSGVNAGVDYGESDYYTVRGWNVSYFRRF